VNPGSDTTGAWPSELILLAALVLVPWVAGVPGVLRRLPAWIRFAGLAGLFPILALVALARSGTPETWKLVSAATGMVLMLLGRKATLRRLERQRHEPDRSFWPWITVAVVPSTLLCAMLLNGLQRDLRLAEARAAEDAASVALLAAERWESALDSRARGFMADVARASAGLDLPGQTNGLDRLLANPGRLPVGAFSALSPTALPEAPWWPGLPPELQAEWTAASLDPGAGAALRWQRLRGHTAGTPASAVAEFQRVRAEIRSGTEPRPIEALLGIRRDTPSTPSQAGIPLAHLVWRELFRLEPPSTNEPALIAGFLGDLWLEPSSSVPSLLDELDRTWASGRPAWREAAARARRVQNQRPLRDALARSIPLDGTAVARFLAVDGEEYLLRFLEPSPAEREVEALPEAVWKEAWTELRRQPPASGSRGFAAALSLGGRRLPLWGPALRSAEVRPLAFRTNGLPGPTVGVVEVSLPDPTAYLADARLRTRLGSVLVLAATVAVLLGIATARKAYLRQQDLNEAQSNFVAGVSHELRAPLASVRLLAENLERGGDVAPERRQEYYRLMVRECRRLGTLVQNVLDWSRIERGRRGYDFAPADLAALVRETARVMEPQFAGRTVRLEVTVAGEPVELEAVVDAAAVQQALVNLLDNALKHAPEGSAVTVGLEATPAGCLISVADSGPGIPASEHARIFDRFHRLGSELRRETEGVGIGLSIVKHIVDGHGGSVRVDSAAGRGARFEIGLPRGRSAGEGRVS